MDQNCIRDLLLYLDKGLAPLATGKLPRPLKLKRFISEPPCSNYPPEDVYAAAQYLVRKQLVTISALEPKYVPMIAPSRYVFLSVTAKGQDYLQAVRDDTLWKNLSKRIGNVFEAAIPELISLAAEMGVKLLLG